MGVLCINGNTTFANYAKTWLETYKKGAISQKNYDTYEANLRLHISPVIGDLKIKDIRRSHCVRVLNAHAGESKSHVGKLRMTMYQIFESAIDDELIVKNPARNLPMPKVIEGTHRSITDFERQHILAVADHHRAGLWIKTMLFCGLRPSEAIDLNWSDVDTKNNFISVSHALGNDTTKTDAGTRRVPMPSELSEGFLKERKFTKTTFVFTQTDGVTHHTAESMRSCWESFLRDLDIDMGAKIYRNQIIVSVVADDLTPYCLRHTFATDMQAAGVPLNIAKVLMGHSDIKMTADIYTHYTAQNEQDAARIINQYYSQEKNSTAAKVRHE
jgi:Site-specific recombinase XerD